MTDKQIIFDDVDVKDCIAYAKLQTVYLGDTVYKQMEKVCMVKNQPCKFFDCQFKQMARELKAKEQECEELRQYHNKCCEEFEKEKKEWLEKYNQVSRDFYSGKYCNAEKCQQLEAYKMEAEEGKEINAELKAENEELKKDVIEALKLVEITSTHNTFQETKINRLSKTLTEIKEIAEDLITITDEYDNCYHKDECDKCLLGIDGNCQYIKVEQILQKISEVEDEQSTNI